MTLCQPTGETRSSRLDSVLADVERDEVLELIDAAWRRGLEAGTAAHGLGMGRSSPRLADSERRARPVAHRSRPVPAGNHGLPVDQLAGRADRVHERRANRRDGGRAERHWILDRPCARNHFDRLAVDRHGAAEQPHPDRAADRRHAGLARQDPAGAIEGPRQRRRAERIPGRRARHDGREQRPPACARCRPAISSWTRSTPSRPTQTARAIRSPWRFSER